MTGTAAGERIQSDVLTTLTGVPDQSTTQPMFSFMERVEDYSGKVLDVRSEDLAKRGRWTPTEEHRALKVRGDRWAVLVVAKASLAVVECARSGTDPWNIWVTCRDDSPCEIDAVGVLGPGRVVLRVTANVVEGVESPTQDSPGVPNIAIEAPGAVRDFIGVAVIGRLSGELICKRGQVGARPGRIASLAQDGGGGKLVGADITGIHAGGLARAGKLSVFSPDVESLYDVACRYDRIAFRLRRWRRGASLDAPKGHDRTPQEQAHWFRDLHNAVGSNAVPASTRAAVRWCYALLEHEAIKPRRQRLSGDRSGWLRRLARREALESLGRWLHRCVGYGQRPSRAFACWLATAVGVTAWSVSSNPVEAGSTGWLERFIQVLLAPLRALRLGSGEPTDPLIGPALDPVASLLLGLPFIFFVLSLREFFRAPLGPPAPTR